MKEPILPDNDKDLQLARRLSSSQESAPAKKDPLFQVLADLKQSYLPFRTSFEPSMDASNALWANIEAETLSGSRRLSVIHAIRPYMLKMAVAASVLITMTIGWLSWRPAQHPTLLAEAGQDIISYSLEDGTSITLRPHSQLHAISSDGAEVRYQLEGEAYFDVAHDPSRTFIVEAGGASVSVLGTKFNVNTWQERVSVYLQEGRVELKNLASDGAIILSPGQAGSVSAEQVFIEQESTSGEEHLDWLNLEIAFSSASLEDVIRELAFHYDIHIDIPEDRADETITGPIALDSLEYALEQLSLVIGGGRFEQTGQARYRFESN